METVPIEAVVFLYRWDLKPGLEEQFTSAWKRLTELLRERGSLGSRLHRGNDGIWYGYAQWPTADAREQAFAGALDAVASRSMQEAVAHSHPVVLLSPISDDLLPLR